MIKSVSVSGTDLLKPSLLRLDWCAANSTD